MTVYHPIEIEFTPYRYEEIHHILKERCGIGFYNGVISKEIIQEVAKRAYESGDLRYGLKLLAKLGEKAEFSGSKQILIEHL